MLFSTSHARSRSSRSVSVSVSGSVSLGRKLCTSSPKDESAPGVGAAWDQLPTELTRRRSPSSHCARNWIQFDLMKGKREE